MADLPITTLMSSSGGGLTWEERLAAKVEARKCLAYDNCVNEEQEKIKYSDFNAIEAYAIPGTMYNPLPVEQQIANAEYIFNYLTKKGWSLKAICGLLGNMHIESHYNLFELEYFYIHVKQISGDQQKNIIVLRKLVLQII
ncbi:MAG: hypothetical protein J6K58_06065 [Lachnospiraceae bacterium]|nr:hypothetical protein [Lachnospiraceae bacterium]